MASDADITMTAIFFTRILGRVQFQQDTKPVKRAKQKDGKSEISDRAGIP
ncbi:hypothetical protein [Streptococcus pantholopis]|nr:hypothetical protein [Streptococcus pantholopis]